VRPLSSNLAAPDSNFKQAPLHASVKSTNGT
jgi:hypothetical protein